MRNKRRGVTLIELMISVSLLVLLIIMAGSVIRFAGTTSRKSVDEFKFQSVMRNTGETLVNQIRESSAIFTIPGSSYRQGNLTAGWDYFGMEVVNEGGVKKTLITAYRYDFDSMIHVREVLYEPPEGVNIDLEFIKKESYTENNLLEFKITGINTSDNSVWGNIESEVSALKALQVVHWGTAADPATAIAVRRTDMNKVSTKVGNVVFVVDCSGSMDSKMDGGSATGANYLTLARTNIMRSSAQVFTNKLADSPKMDLGIVTYSDYAGMNTGNIVDFKNVSANMNYFLNTAFAPVSAKTSSSKPLYTGGNTNTGDGIRRGIYMLQEKDITERAKGRQTLNFLVVLTDGEANYSVKWNGSYYYGKEPVNTNLRSPSGTYYQVVRVSETAQKVQPDGTRMTGGQIYSENMAREIQNILPGTKTYLIGLGTTVNGSDGLRRLSEAMGTGSKGYFQAGDVSALEDAFSAIADEITAELWAVTGPSLKN